MEKHFQFKRTYWEWIIIAIVLIGFTTYNAINISNPPDHSHDYIPVSGRKLSPDAYKYTISDSMAKAEQKRWRKFTLHHAKKNRLENMIEEKVQEYGPQ